MKKSILHFLLLLLMVQPAAARVYKVKSAAVFKSIISKLEAGDEVIIANGHYNNWALYIPSLGQPAKPITIRAEVPGKVIFSGDVPKPIFKLTGAYVVLKGLAFEGCTLNGKSAMLIEMNNAKNCRLTHCTFTGNESKTAAIPLVGLTGNATSNTVDSCIFSGSINVQDIKVRITKDSIPQFTLINGNIFKNKSKVTWKDNNAGECVQIGQDPILWGRNEAKSLVTNNRFIRCNGEPEVISNKSSANKYINNYFEDNDGELVMRGGHDCLIEGNIFKGGTGGIRISGTGHTIVKNKIDSVKTAIRLMYGMAKGKYEIGFYIAASNCIIENNEISNATTGILIGDGKGGDWTGKYDTVKYPSPPLRNVAPFDNKISGNKFIHTTHNVMTN